MFVPVGAEHFETAYLGGGAYVTTDAGTDIVVADTNKTDGVGGILRKTVGTNAFRQLVTTDELEGDGQVFVYQALHLALYLLFFLPRRLVVEIETHLALLALYMSIIRTFAAEDANHRLI